MLLIRHQLYIAIEQINIACYKRKWWIHLTFRITALFENEVFEEWENDGFVVEEVNMPNKSSHILLARWFHSDDIL